MNSILNTISNRLRFWREISIWPWTQNITVETMSGITVHPDTWHPVKAWSKLALKQTVEKVQPLHPDTPVMEDHLRFVCVSDTHNKMPNKLPAGDVLLHAGDLTSVGQPREVQKFNDVLGSLPHAVKVVIAGNHDLTFDDDMMKNQREHLKNQFRFSAEGLESKLSEMGVTSVKDILTNCVYLEDAAIDICGINIYGSPWQPVFCDWAFNLPRGQPCLDKWDLIPNNTDILITHGPPIGHGDKCFDGARAGCVELLTTVQKRVKPKYHLFGHIHEGYGITSDGTTTYINASTCTLQYRPDNPPIVFDFPIPEGRTKADLLNIAPHKRIRGQPLEPNV